MNVNRKFLPLTLRTCGQRFAGPNNLRSLDTLDITGAVVRTMNGKVLKYSTLIVDNGLDFGARS